MRIYIISKLGYKMLPVKYINRILLSNFHLNSVKYASEINDRTKMKDCNFDGISVSDRSEDNNP